MAKQIIVTKVDMSNGKKRRMALKIAAGIAGVESVALIGSNKDQIKVTGEGIDPVKLTMLLRKGVGCTNLVSVGRMEEKKSATTTVAASQMTAATVVPLQVYPHHHYRTYGGSSYYDTYKSHSNDDPSCTIT